MTNHSDIYAGKRLKSIRKERRLSQKELAKNIDVAYQQVQKYESGINRISLSRLDKICCYLSVSPTEFFNSPHSKGRQ